MPAVLERCVAKVKDQGHPEQNAYAICRASLGLRGDGSQDGIAMELTDEQMEARLAPALKFQNGPMLRKRVVISRAVGEFINGPQEGIINRAFLKQLVENFKKHPRQVPVYLLTGQPPTDEIHNPDYVTDLDTKLADGWVEALDLEGDNLMGDLSLHGAAAAAVLSDSVRGASIGTIRSESYDGTDIGQVLQHVVLTNRPFVKGMNIAARLANTGDRLAYHFTALPKEAPVADDKNKKADPAPKGDESVNLTEKLTAAETLNVEQAGLIRELTASRDNLLEEVKAFKASPNLQLANEKIAQLERNNLAEKVRRLTAGLAKDGQIAMEELRGWYDHDSDEVVLAGFKGSQFKGKLDLLKYHRASVPKKPGNRSFNSGTGDEGDSTDTLTPEAQAALRDEGKDPAKVGKKHRNFTDWKRDNPAKKAS